MTKQSIGLDDNLYAYLLDVSLRESDVARRLRQETAGMAKARMQIAPEQGQFMALLVELIGARKALEVGTFTGYSALCVAMALPSGGRLVACDVNEEWTAIGERYWKEAGVSDKIELRLAPAIETLDALIAAGEEGTFDFAFIDAHKPEYEDYFERALTLLRPGGLACVDNVLWRGRVVDPAKMDGEDTQAIMAFNRKILDDERVSLSMVPIGDGLTLARKRP
ncbi:MAG: class I SAM-dependent methyltransferase [Rhodospirillales bacterium]|jgi:predicted O-methyltransferase YrrM|nr:class I SAM-dependent methyltransferase [Rhodospirillales bacterium]